MERSAMDQTEFTKDELLESLPVAEPLIAGGIRCHGGFDQGGAYLSPRTAKRTPAIRAWQAKHVRDFGTDVLDVPMELWPGHYPNVAQAQFLIREGVVRPMITTLTRIGTVEGFGAGIRRAAVPDIQRFFDEDIQGTATAHLDQGLYEAHARDEAGFDDQGGHRQMWFAARDIAFENPDVENEVMRMLEMMGLPTSYGAATPSLEELAAMRRRAMQSRQLDPDIDFELESQIARMIRLLFIELAAFRTFSWAEAVLEDADLVAGDGAAARLVSYIRADETPHVEYLKTSLSEIRDRTVIGISGRKHPGRELVVPMWQRALDQSLQQNRRANRDMQLRAIEHELRDHPRRSSLLEEFHHLGDVRPGADGAWIEPTAEESPR